MPASCFQRSHSLDVTLARILKLGEPVLSIHSRNTGNFTVIVLMPEASVNKHNRLTGWQNNIGASGEITGGVVDVWFVCRKSVQRLQVCLAPNSLKSRQIRFPK